MVGGLALLLFTYPADTAPLDTRQARDAYIAILYRRPQGDPGPTGQCWCELMRRRAHTHCGVASMSYADRCTTNNLTEYRGYCKASDLPTTTCALHFMS